jgi:hypothetical protein
MPEKLHNMVSIMQMEMLNVAALIPARKPSVPKSMQIVQQLRVHRTSSRPLARCIAGDWSCQCPACRYGDVLIIYINMSTHLRTPLNSRHSNQRGTVLAEH